MKFLSEMISIVLFITIVSTFSMSIHSAYSQSVNFTESINLSNNDGSSRDYDIAVSGNNVYVAWIDSVLSPDRTTESSNILFRASRDNGKSFDRTITIGGSYGSTYGPRIAAFEDNVYVVWKDGKNIMFSRSTDGGSDFSLPIALSDGSKDSNFPQIAAYGKYVYVTWEYGDISYEAGVFTNTEILIRVSNDNGVSFSPAINLSNNNGTSSLGSFGQQKKIVAYGNNVYVVWHDRTPGKFDIFLAKSTDNGNTFDSVNLTNNDGNSAHPEIVAFHNNLYITWQDDTHTGGRGAFSDIFFTKSTDNGCTFSEPINLSNSPGSEHAHVSVYGKNVYVIWRTDKDGNLDIFFARSQDNGDTFEPKINLSSSTAVSTNAHITVSGSNVYVAWQEKVGNKFEAFFRASTDYGVNFEPAIDLSKGVGDSAAPKVVTSEDGVYVTWIDNGVGNTDIFFRAGTNPSFKPDTMVTSVEPSDKSSSCPQSTETPPSALAPITITSVNNPKPRWGLDEVTISGTAKASSLDTITIDWGDNTILNIRIIKSDGSWGPASHTYDMEHVGKRQIVAKLFSGRVLKASSTYEVDVQKHATSITIDPIPNEAGSSVTVTGSLFDIDAKAGITGRIVTFNATGIEGLSQTVTFRDGIFSSEGTIKNAADLTVEAYFAGDELYLPSFNSTGNYENEKTMESMIELSDIALLDIDGKKITKLATEQKVMVEGKVTNEQDKKQPFTYIVQIKDSHGTTIFLSWIKGSLQTGKSMKAAVGWTPDASGKYTAEIFVWESLTNPRALSEVSRIKVTVS